MIEYVKDVPVRLEDGQIWKVGGFPQTARSGTLTVKSYKGLGNCEAKALEALECWKGLGFSGNPASAASFFRKQFEKMKKAKIIDSRINASYNNLLRQGFYGGWIEVMQRGFCRGPLFHYDLNKAYFWAGAEGLPMRVRTYRPGDKNFMVLARIRSNKRDLPVMIENRKKVLLTNEDVDLYGVRFDVINGVSWASDVDRFYPEDVLVELLGNVPEWLFTKMLSTYWGIFAQHIPVEREIWKGGELTKTLRMQNRFQNIFWAQTIIARVTRKVYAEAQKGIRQVYVDSVLSDHEIVTGTGVGDWRLCGEFPKGVMINAPGVWTPWPIGRKIEVNQWYKHAGYSDIR